MKKIKIQVFDKNNFTLERLNNFKNHSVEIEHVNYCSAIEAVYFEALSYIPDIMVFNGSLPVGTDENFLNKLKNIKQGVEIIVLKPLDKKAADFNKLVYNTNDEIFIEEILMNNYS